MILINLKKFVKIGLKLVSSGENKKSSIFAGDIIEYGFPFIKITTLPCNKYLQHLSGLSVEITCGTPKV